MTKHNKPILVREPDAGKPPVRFDERGVKTEHGRRILRHNRGNPETEVSRSLPHRVTPRLYRSLQYQWTLICELLGVGAAQNGVLPAILFVLAPAQHGAAGVAQHGCAAVGGPNY
jgi:hypothetical protein